MMAKNTQFVGIFALLFILASGAVLLCVLYLVTTIGTNLESQVVTIAEHRAKEKTYNALSTVVTASAEDRAVLDTFVLTEEDTSSFLTDIEHIGALQQVELVTDSLEVKKQAGLFNVLTIRFTIIGTKSAVQKMINIFETLPYHSQITSLNLSYESSQKTKGTLELKVSLRKKDEEK